MAVHDVGGEKIEVTPSSKYYWFYRRQGILVEISPKRKWWCAWLCSSTTEIDEIRCSIVLSGVVPDHETSGNCSKCGNLRVMGPAYWGASVPKAYLQARYAGSVRIRGNVYTINGSVIFL